MGGISRTVNFKGNRIDIGGHRFFSKSDRVMQWWLNMLPLDADAGTGPATIKYHQMETVVRASDPKSVPGSADSVMLLRPRKSRIYYLRRFFDYPISLSRNTLSNLGLIRCLRIGISYVQSALFPRRQETTLEHFFINRFGKELYTTFFKSYTEKVWGVPCDQIDAAWGVQRIKGLSVWKTLTHALKKVFRGSASIAQKDTQTLLIEQFLYPKFGPGQMWEETACCIKQSGGEIHTGYRFERLLTDGWRVRGVQAVDSATGQLETFEGDYFFSTVPIKDFMRAFDVAPPGNVLAVSDGLIYRDFITVGLLVRSLRIQEDTPCGKKLIADNWIYVQEPDVLLCRLQIFNNWSPSMVADPANVWLGLEYVCDKSDDIWNLSDEAMIAFAKEELSRIGIIDASAVVDSTVLRMEKAYPAYFGTFDRFAEIRAHVDRYQNLFLIGRNGMHRYNNQDHSMLTAMLAVDDIIAGKTDKSELWEVNTEMDYHEQKKVAK